MKNQKAFMLVGMLVFASIAILLINTTISGAISNIKLSQRLYDREKAFHIAEAGNEYYRWHLAHANLDFQDGTGTTTPYIHNVKDIQGNSTGSFKLTITPPTTGSTIVSLTSEGSVLTSSTTRKIETKLAIPSLAKFAVVADAAMRFGAGTEVFGPLHSNNGIRFDGVAHNIVTSALSTYTDTDSDRCTSYSWAVHTCLGSSDPVPPGSIPIRDDVFAAGRQFPVPALDFSGMTTDLASMKSIAQSAGKYFTSSGSGFLGYHIVLKSNDTFDIYKVTNLASTPSGCSESDTGWGTWSIKASNGQTFIQNYPLPTNGIIFVEDNVWVDGQINTARVTIAAGKFPDNASTRPNIIVNSNLLYTNYDGQDVIALISQGNFNIGLLSDDNLRIDAAIVAQNGRVGRYHYGASCGSSNVRSKLTLYGMIATNKRYGFAWTDNTGYTLRNLNYDGNLLYGPPPSFPLTSSQYSTISWKEVK